MIRPGNDVSSREEIELGHISIDKSKEETSVEELSAENSIGNISELFTVGLLFDPLDKLDYDSPENNVEDNDNTSDGVTQVSRIYSISKVEVADGHFVVTVEFLVQFDFLADGFGMVCFHVLAVALVCSRVSGLLSRNSSLIVSLKFPKSVILKLVQFDITTILLIELILLAALNNRVSQLQSQAGGLEEEDKASSAAKHEENDNDDNNFLQGSALCGSILPDNVSWLGSLLNINLLTEEILVDFLHMIILWSKLSGDGSRVQKGSPLALFALERNEYRAWVLELIQKFAIGFLDRFDDFIVQLINLVVFLGDNQSASLLEPRNNDLVVISKSYLSYLDLVLSFPMFRRIGEALVRHCLNSLFQLGLNI